MEVYRLSRRKFGNNLSGKGSAIKGARWNSVGVELIYTAANRSLAMAEVAVHTTLASLPDDFVMMTIYIPDDISMAKLDIKILPENWNIFPYLAFPQLIGDRFATDNENCLLQVPSSVTLGDYNFLINPRHTEFNRIKIVDSVAFPFDKRIFE